MIFRPYEAKYIFGIKIPFTPGLIAVERNNITSKIGDVITTNLLTDDDLTDRISNLDFEKIIQNIIDSIEYEIKNNDKTLNTVLKELYQDDYESKISHIHTLISNYYENILYNSKDENDFIFLENNLRLALPDILNIINDIFKNDMYNIDKSIISFFDSIIDEYLKGFGASFSSFYSSSVFPFLLFPLFVTPFVSFLTTFNSLSHCLSFIPVLRVSPADALLQFLIFPLLSILSCTTKSSLSSFSNSSCILYNAIRFPLSLLLSSVVKSQFLQSFFISMISQSSW